jgi:hypothetical protein
MRVNLAITDRCSRSCKDCCCGIPLIKDHWDISFVELENAAKFISGTHTIRLTGGESSMHPLFKEIVQIARDIFKCSVLEIETNGYYYDKDLDVFEPFDLIEITNYHAPEFKPNQKEIESFLGNMKLRGKVHVGDPVVHFPRARRGTNKCERGNLSMVSLYKNRVYPCAMGWGIEDPVSVPLSKDWFEKLKSVELPCNRCFMADT